MRARIEAAQRRRSRRRTRCLCFWFVALAALSVAGAVLRGKPVPVVSFTSASPQQEQPAAGSNSASDSDNDTAAVAGDSVAQQASAEEQLPAKAAGGDGLVAGVDSKVYFYTGKGDALERHELVEDPLPGDCHAEVHADYEGAGISWGLDHKTRSAAACCAACKARSAPPDGCNVWVWCGDPSGVCWTPDVWNHTTGACWLKRQEGWDGNTDAANTNLVVNARGDYSEAYRQEHRTAPASVPWVAGLVKAPS